MNEFNPAKSDLARAEAIRRQYMERGVSKIDQLRALHDKVKAPGTIVSFIVGIFGTLIMGAGMANVMVWSNMENGLFLSIPGLAMLLLAYPLYSGITGKRKRKYAQQIMALSDEIMGGKELQK
ncbi:MAG: hypothetical protein NC305_05035 [Lachnospiraceae bacterium]|nr:hypothetical protein [Muribaculum sp.]MCM1409892.1 hypothetical protein [Lachnospiraceae bacterium]